MLVLLHSRVKVQEKGTFVYMNICIQYVHSQPSHTRKREQTPLTHACSAHRSEASANQILTVTCLAKLILQAGQQLRHLQYLHIFCHALDHHSYNLVCEPL